MLLPVLFATPLAACGKAKPPQPPATKPALTVTTTTQQLLDWPRSLKASGNMAAWQVVGIVGDAVEGEYAQTLTGAATALARLDTAKARLQSAKLRRSTATVRRQTKASSRPAAPRSTR